MGRIGRSWVAAGLLAALLFSLVGCGQTRPPAAAEAVLAAMMDTSTASQACRTYSRSAAPREGDYLSDTLFSALLGEASRGLLTGNGDAPPPVNDAAIGLSVSPTPAEWMVLRCSDARATATAAGLAQARLDTVRRAWAGTEWADLTQQGRVVVEGGYVLLIISETPDKALASARRLIARGGI